MLRAVAHAHERRVAGDVGGIGLRARGVVHAMDDGVEARVAALDARDGGVDQLAGMHRAGAHQLGQAERVVAIVIGGHRRERRRSRWRRQPSDGSAPLWRVRLA